MATAEFAVALPAVVLVVTFIVTLMQVLVLRHQALHAASVGARVAARGESDAAVRQAVRASGADAGQISIDRAGATVRVSVSVHAATAVDWAMPEITQSIVAPAEQADAGGVASGATP